MEYLKCNSCGHLNKLKTEYQVFCADCNNKLDNNYSDWKRKHSDKSFEDFKTIECFSEEDINRAKLEKQKKVKRKGAKYWIGLIATVAVVTITSNLINFSVTDFFKEATFDKAMMAAASQVNESCPIMIDSETRLDNAIALPNKVFQYNYTLINYSKQDLNLEEVKEQIEPGIVNFVKTNPDMKIQRDFKSTIKYAYKDKDGIHLFTIEVSPEMYKEKS